MNALFIGYGSMGSAIGEAWLAKGLVAHLAAVVPSMKAATTATLYPSTSAVPATPFDVIVVAVKPAYACEVLEQLADACCQGAVVVSVAAGITSASLRQALGNRCPVVRAMPNMPVTIGAGCTALFGEGLSAEQRTRIGKLFAAVGSANWVEREELMDAVTAISGSGTAYYHLFSEALTAAAVGLGLSPELASALVAQTAYGSASLQMQPGADFGQLRRAVTSPNGTTAAAIDVFEHDQGLRQLVDLAARAAHHRSQALSQDA